MRYFFAVICPPLAFVVLGRWPRAVVASLLFGLAIVTAGRGYGIALEFLLILWAFGSVGDEEARVESVGFVRLVKESDYRRH